ncbi:MAG: GNAT family N-acetyltransferase [Myxococcota bacterium]|nr:GNAT family N-acetyltransferase [Myxococcota bacterium]
MRSRSLHGRWVHAPDTPQRFAAYLKHIRAPSSRGHWLCTEDGELAGVVNVTQIVLGVFRSAYLGYYAFAPHAGRGYLRAGLVQVLERAFREYGLHRLEANIQPENTRSIQLVKSLGFELEGYSPKYLKLAGRWRDHERWAIRVETWRGRKHKR